MLDELVAARHEHPAVSLRDFCPPREQLGLIMNHA